MAAPPAPPALPGPPPPRPPLLRHPGRVLTVVIVVGSVITLGVWAISSAETETGLGRNVATFPSSIETLSPGPGELARLQDTITVDLADDLTGVMRVTRAGSDGFEVPEDQLERIVPLGQFSFRTGPGQELSRFEPGTYTVTVLYWPQAKPRPDNPASYSYQFRAGA